jgi:hypothetical protein
MMMIGRPWRWRRSESDRGNAVGLPRGVKPNVDTSGGAFVLAEKSCCSWRPQNESPRQRQAHKAGHICGDRPTYASTHIRVSIRAGRHHPMFRSNHSTFATWDGQERRLFYVLAFLPYPRTKPRSRARNADCFDHLIGLAVHVAAKATVDHRAWNWGHAVLRRRQHSWRVSDDWLNG